MPFTDVGDPAEVRLDALGSQVFQGETLPVRGGRNPEFADDAHRDRFAQPEERVGAGMYGIATIFLTNEAKSSTLPASCLEGESKGGKANVYVIKDGKAKKTRVEVGLDDGIRVKILCGLTPQDDVIVDSQRGERWSLRVGQPAKPWKNSRRIDDRSDVQESLWNARFFWVVLDRIAHERKRGSVADRVSLSKWSAQAKSLSM